MVNLLRYKEALEDSAEKERSREVRYRKFTEIILKNIRGKCLEIGCGDGLWSAVLKRYIDGLISIDLSEKRIKIARKTNQDVNFILCDARNLPFKDKSFDSICALEVIEHLPTYDDQHMFLREIKRTLKKTGVFVLSTPNQPLFRIYCKILREKHPTHFSELNYFQFKSILETYFRIVKIYGNFGWLSPFYKSLIVRKIHNFLSKATPFCKGLLGVCREN